MVDPTDHSWDPPVIFSLSFLPFLLPRLLSSPLTASSASPLTASTANAHGPRLPRAQLRLPFAPGLRRSSSPTVVPARVWAPPPLGQPPGRRAVSPLHLRAAGLGARPGGGARSRQRPRPSPPMAASSLSQGRAAPTDRHGHPSSGPQARDAPTNEGGDGLTESMQVPSIPSISRDGRNPHLKRIFSLGMDPTHIVFQPNMGRFGFNPVPTHSNPLSKHTVKENPVAQSTISIEKIENKN